MTVMAREAWTDERLDDLAKRMDKGFEEVKGEVGDLRSEMNARFAAVDQRFDSMQRTMVIGFVSLIASMVGAVFAGVVGAGL